MGLIIAAIIIFALFQRRKYRRISDDRCDRRSRRWERVQPHEGVTGHTGQDGEDKWDKWTRQWQEWERRTRDARDQTAELGLKVASKLGMAEAKLRRGADRLRGVGSTAGSPDAGSSSDRKASKAYGPLRSDRTREFRQDHEPPLDSEEERAAYERARRRAAREAGFYVHLMWYGIVIGSLLILNLIVSPSFEWWVFPALAWGMGLASHFGAVYGWRWIHERVFEPAIQREVQREVTLEKEVLRTEKQASLDELTASFAHEIRNPIAAAKSLVQQMGEDPTSSENVEYAKVALDELARVERSVSHLLKYARETDYSFENVGLAPVLDHALTEMRAKLEASHVSVSRNYIGGPTVRADADKLRQVFTNVIDNAIDATESNTGERRLEFGIRSLYPGTATVVIRDNGCGISEDKLGKIFNPFYTTKKNGTGLGMGIAKKVMDAHSGRIEVQSKPGAGTEFRLSVPLADTMRSQADNGFNQAEAVDVSLTNPAPTDPDGKQNASAAPGASEGGATSASQMGEETGERQ